ncbi:MAG: transglutaminase-like domain-containing protein, partial [Verrucomicrobiota bacterium]|nr:transglutaminase-like domain-containing protein [Verrucomicrobiota bacterium]
EKRVSKHWKPGETRSLNADERISFTVLSLYLFIFCACTYFYWPTLPMKIVGGTAALLGVMLVSTAVLNKGTVPRKHSRYTRGWYLLSFFSGLLVLVALRSVVRHIGNHIAVASIIGGSLLFLFATFRKAIVQILMAFLAMVFVFVISENWSSTVGGELGFLGALRTCGQVVFKIQPFEEVANSLIAGNYMVYLNKVDYRDPQINMVAIRTVAGSADDALQKTRDILRFVSNDIHYVSDPADGVEYAKDPVSTIISGGGDCEDQTVVLCSLLESVGVKTFMAFTAEHVFALVRFSGNHPELAGVPKIDVEGLPCYVLDAADPDAELGYGSAAPTDIERVFDVRRKALVKFSIPGEG